MKKTKIIISITIFCLFAFNFSEGQAYTLSEREEKLQRIEILKQEISVYQSLLSNLNKNKEVLAPSYLIFDINEGDVIQSKNINTQYSIASVTKLMTAVVALEKIEDLDSEITITSEMTTPYGYSPAIFLGGLISARNLLCATLIQSTNDAAESLSFFLGKENFVFLMNEKADEIGMENTHYQDPHGLSPNNKSTANDLKKLLTYINENHPLILETTKRNDFWLSGSDGKLLKFRNMNNFYPLPYFVGGKTGYIPEAKQSFVGLFEVNNKSLGVVILFSDNRQADLFALLRSL
ncbi:MAG: serine hydrolase [Candidatus Pacebacteria bacterium]|nr:serine hydrolase [Candidatus Paceibacterota bacterium]